MDKPDKSDRYPTDQSGAGESSNLSLVVDALNQLNSTLVSLQSQLESQTDTTSPGGPPPRPRGVDATEQLLSLITAALAADPTPITITEVSPAEGPSKGGQRVTIRGSNFVPGIAAFFGGTAATDVRVESETTITALTPAGNGVVDVTVVFGGAAVKERGFTYR